MIDKLNIPTLYKFIPGDGNQILICSISDVTDLISDEIIEQYHVGHSMERALQLACADRIVSSIYGDSIRLTRNADGSPKLNGTKHCISISHTDDFMAIYFSASGKVAVDIELLGRNITAVKYRFTNDFEVDMLSPLAFSEPLLQIWSIKECLFKVIPVDKVLFKEHLNLISVVPTEHGTICKAHVVHPELNANYSIESRIFEPLIVSFTVSN